MAEERIAQFWRLFGEVQEELRTLESADHPSYEALLSQLQLVHDGLYLEFSTGPGQPELIVTAEGDSSLFALVTSVVAAAPESLLWTILALKPRIGFPVTASWENLTIKVGDVSFCPLERPGTLDLGLRLFVPGIGPGDVENAHNALLRAMDHGLGERTLATTVCYTEVVPASEKALSGELIPLLQLEEYIRWRQRRHNRSPETNGIAGDKPTEDFEAWRHELIATGPIVQDGDDSIPWPERERRFNRYVELVDAVTGKEGVEAGAALIQSLQSRHDYGAYQATQRALGRFPLEDYVRALIQELPALIQRQPDWAGELVCGLANSVGTSHEPDIAEFCRQLRLAPGPNQDAIRGFVLREEQDGWLRHRRGVLS